MDDEIDIARRAVGQVMWKYVCAMKRIDGMGEIPTGSIREPVSRWG
jgi:hypothetical protein